MVPVGSNAAGLKKRTGIPETAVLVIGAAQHDLKGHGYGVGRVVESAGLEAILFDALQYVAVHRGASRAHDGNIDRLACGIYGEMNNDNFVVGICIAGPLNAGGVVQLGSNNSVGNSHGR